MEIETNKKELLKIMLLSIFPDIKLDQACTDITGIYFLSGLGERNHKLDAIALKVLEEIVTENPSLKATSLLELIYISEYFNIKIEDMLYKYTWLAEEYGKPWVQIYPVPEKIDNTTLLEDCKHYVVNFNPNIISMNNKFYKFEMEKFEMINDNGLIVQARFKEDNWYMHPILDDGSIAQSGHGIKIHEIEENLTGEFQSWLGRRNLNVNRKNNTDLLTNNYNYVLFFENIKDVQIIIDFKKYCCDCDVIGLGLIYNADSIKVKKVGDKFYATKLLTKPGEKKIEKEIKVYDYIGELTK